MISSHDDYGMALLGDNVIEMFQNSHNTTAVVVDDEEKVNKNSGLSSEQARLLQWEHGPNDIDFTINKRNERVFASGSGWHILKAIFLGIIAYTRQGLFAKFLEQFQNPLIMLLLASAIISLFLGQVENCVSISIAVLIVGTVAFIQEYRTEKSLEALHRLAPPKCRVVRDNMLREMLAVELVPGDFVELRTGDRVPADIRLIEAVDLEIDESMLTGEAKPSRKRISQEGDVGLALMATLVRQGHGRGIVTFTGSGTRLGKMYTLMKETEEKRSPLQCHLDHLGQQLSIYSLIVISILAFVGIMQRQPLMQVFTVAVSLAVAAVPEGLPIVATITLALGILRLSRKNVIVKKLPAVEALGSVDVLCLDKTGTLTMNQLTVQSIYSCTMQREIKDFTKENLKPISDLLRALELCNNGRKSLDGEWHGNGVDVAIMQFLEKHSPKTEIYRKMTRTDEVSFTSEKKFMAVQYMDEGSQERFYFVKGAPEIIIPGDLSQRDIYSKCESMWAEGLRVIAVAAGSNPKNLQIIGLVGMCDPPRPDMRETLSRLYRCGVKCVMVTGDSKHTAISVANQVGWPIKEDSVVNGDDLTTWINESKVDNISIVYRATPEQKLHLVKALQAGQHVVAMTGDGVNDAPALKMADIGIAMGRGGTDVARAAAQVILTDDRLSSLLDGIEEGKTIFSNIRHFLRFQLSTSLAALALIAAAMFSGVGSMPPMNAMQILLVNIIMDGPPAQSLGVEPVDPKALNCGPRGKSAPILSKKLLLRTMLTALHIFIGTFLVFQWERRTYGEAESTRTFAIFVLFSIFNANASRSNDRSIFSIGFFSNKFLLASSILSFGMLLGIIYVPTLSKIFLTVPLTLTDWKWLIAISSSLLIVDEILKLFLSTSKTNIRVKRTYKALVQSV